MKKVTKLPQPNDFSCDMYNTEEDYFYGKDCMKKVEYRIVHNSTPIARQDLFSNLGKHISGSRDDVLRLAELFDYSAKT